MSDARESDAGVWRAFVQAEQRWLAVLAPTRALHEAGLGQRLTAVQWLPELGRGSCGWLGYYWEAPPFWFGFGLRGTTWLPLIECDVRRCDPDFLNQLEVSLPAAWRTIDRAVGRYWRLWSPPEIEGDSAAQIAWFDRRSRELHEFTVSA